MCDDFTVRYFDIDALHPGRFLTFSDEVRLPNTTRLIDIVMRRKPGTSATQFPAWRKFLDIEGLEVINPDRKITLQLDLIRSDDESFSLDILRE